MNTMEIINSELAVLNGTGLPTGRWLKEVCREFFTGEKATITSSPYAIQKFSRFKSVIISALRADKTGKLQENLWEAFLINVEPRPYIGPFGDEGVIPPFGLS